MRSRQLCWLARRQDGSAREICGRGEFLLGGYQNFQYSYAPGNKRVWRGVWNSGTLAG